MEREICIHAQTFYLIADVGRELWGREVEEERKDKKLGSIRTCVPDFEQLGTSVAC